MNAVNPPVSILEIPQPHHVLDALLQRLDRPIHHRCRGSETTLVGVMHDLEPFVGCGLAVTMQQAPHTIDQNLRSSAGNTVETRGNQPIDDLTDTELRQPRKMNDLRW